MILRDKNLILIYHQRSESTGVNGNFYKKEGQRIWCCSKSRGLFHNGPAALYSCVEVRVLPAHVFDPTPAPISRNMLKGDKPLIFVPNITIEHWNTRKSMKSLISRGSSLSDFRLCGHWASDHIYPVKPTLLDLECEPVPSFRDSFWRN